MTHHSLDHEIATLTHQKAAIDAQIATLEAQRAQPWPRRTTVPLFANYYAKDAAGRTLGLTEDALEEFLAYDFRMGLEVDVHADGRTSPVAVTYQGQRLLL